MIHPPLQRHMLANTDRHILCRRHIDHWWLARIGIGDPECDGESIRRATKVDWQRTHEVKKQGGEAIFIRWQVSQLG